MGMYVKYTPIRVDFDLAPSLTPSNNKCFVVIRGIFIREIREFRESSAHKVGPLPKLLKLPNHYQRKFSDSAVQYGRPNP